MLNSLSVYAKHLLTSVLKPLEGGFRNLTAPATSNPLLAGVGDLAKSRTELIAENALLRQQLLVLNRKVTKPKFQPADRLLLVIFASLVKSWHEALLIVKPDTLLKWHRSGFKLFCYFKSRAKPEKRKSRISQEIIELIKKMASENPLWGAKRIRGELLKLNVKVAKRTIHKYLRQAKLAPAPTQSWRTFLKNHAFQIWACDFLPVTDIFFRQLYAFVIIELESRKIVHIGVSRHDGRVDGLTTKGSHPI